MNMALGKPMSSKKNIIEESAKKQAKNGLNRRLPIGLATDKGNPHQSKSGKSTRVRKSCNCIKVSKYQRTFLSLGMNIVQR